MEKSIDMKIIGLTGPSGAGKGFCYGYFKSRAIPCIDTDDVYHKLLIPPSACVDELVKNFGTEILTHSNTVDRKTLAEIVFSDKTHSKLKTLNTITHKYVIEKTKELLNCYRTSGAKAAVIDAPLLFEADVDKMCDFTIAVISDTALRLERIIKRDAITKEAAQKRIESQNPADFYTSRATYSVVNDADADRLYKQLECILKKEAVVG